MNKTDYSNPLGNQVLSLPQMAEEQIQACFCDETMEELMSMAEIFDVRKIYITGCGDSIAAAGTMAPIIKRFTGVVHCEMIEPMEFSRFLSIKDAGGGAPNMPLVIAISAGGGTARISEILQKANEMGAFSILLTNNVQSLAAVHAKRIFYLNTPKMKDDFPGLRSYFASIIGLIAIACRIGIVKGILSSTEKSTLKQTILSYVQSYETLLPDIDKEMFELAESWKDFERFDFIGDGAELYSAIFIMEKFIECAGIHGNYDDSENWCHIDYHVKTPETVGTVVLADKNSPAFGRTKETVRAACGIKRPILVITNAKRSEFPDEVNVCCIPETPKGYEWLMPVMDFAPGAILAGYCGTRAKRKFFNEYDTFAKEYNGGNIFFNQSNMTMKNSKIEIHL